MTYTEEEASTKWCPFARADGGRVSINRAFRGEVDSDCFCIGSACMAWRWGKMLEPQSNPFVDSQYVEDRSRGYCGLATKP